MEIKEDFTVEKTQTETIGITKEYFRKSKFKTLKEEGTTLVFGRGNTLLNFVTINPLQWRSAITVETADMRPVRVTVHAKISTLGQLATPHERDVWRGFIGNFKNTLTLERDFTEKNAVLVKKAKRKTYLVLMAIGCIAVMAGFIIGLLIWGR